MHFLSRKKRLADLELPSEFDRRKRTSILVIDDDPHSFPIEHLQREGYQIQYWPKVDTLLPLESGSFDIIVLDIQGVAQHISPDDGLAVLEAIKRSNPAQIVVAFSAHSFDLSKTAFWRLADDALRKPVDAATCKRVLDGLIASKRTPSHYWASIQDLLRQQHLTPKQIATLESKLSTALEKRDIGSVRSSVKNAIDNADIAVKAIGLAVKIAALWGLAP